MITIQCECGQALRVDEKFAGRMGTCPKCKKSIRIPGGTAPAAAAPQAAADPAPAANSPPPLSSRQPAPATVAEPADALNDLSAAVQQAPGPATPPPGYYAQPSASPYPGYMPPHQWPSPNAPGALPSLICGLIGAVVLPGGLCCGLFSLASLVLGIVALVLGLKAKSKIARNPGMYGGKGMATAGFILGIVGTIGGLIWIIVIVAFLVSGGFVNAFHGKPNQFFPRP
ncbi:MAG: DUF4190 domain-containing protein [Thermoguttaceae bacterium]